LIQHTFHTQNPELCLGRREKKNFSLVGSAREQSAQTKTQLNVLSTKSIIERFADVFMI